MSASLDYITKDKDYIIKDNGWFKLGVLTEKINVPKE